MKIKKLIAALATVAMLASNQSIVSGVSYAAEVTGQFQTLPTYGDANVDGKVTIADATAILQNVANKDKFELKPQGKINADIVDRGDGVTARDALAIQMADAQVISVSDFPITSEELEKALHKKDDTSEESVPVTKEQMEVMKDNPLLVVDKDSNSLFVYGDMNGDMKLDAADVTAVEKHVADKSAYKKVADLDGDNDVDADDIELLNNYLNNSSNLFPVYSQYDSDADGLNDYIEIAVLGTNRLDADTDKDNLTDLEEVLLTSTDPTVPDSAVKGTPDSDIDLDDDKIINKDEIKYGTSPLLADSDNDDLDDYAELFTYKTDPLVPDSDKDTIDDGSEIKLGLDPNKPQTFDVPDGEYQVAQVLSSDNSVFDMINLNNDQYAVSLNIKTNRDIEKNLFAYKSGNYCMKDNDSVIGNCIDIEISDDCSPSSIVINFNIKDDYVNNTLNKYTEFDRFDGIKRLAVFKYFEEVNAYLPLDTKYDTENKTISAELEDDGSYCIVDTEKWLDSMDISPDEIKQDNNSSELKMSGSQILASNDLTVDSQPIDLVFMIQSGGLTGEEAFDYEKELIKKVSKFAFEKYDDVRVHIVPYDSSYGDLLPAINGRYWLQDLGDVETVLSGIEYHTNIMVASRNVGLRKCYNDIERSYRPDSKYFVYNLMNYETYFMEEIMNGYTFTQDFQLVQYFFWANNMIFSEVRYNDKVFDTTLHDCIINDFSSLDKVKGFSEVRNQIMGNDGVDLTLDTTTESNYNAIIANLTKHFPIATNDGMYSPLDGKKIVLKGELNSKNNIDSDGDGIPDWKEVNTKFLIIHEDGTIELPAYGRFIDNVDSTVYKESIEKFIKGVSTAAESIDAIMSLKVLPFNSNPTKTDSDSDGYWDCVDPDPISAPALLEKYDMFDGEIYSFGYISDLDDPMCFRIVNEEKDKIKGTQLKAVVGNGEKNQRFIFKWRDSKGGYSIHPLINTDFALTMDATSQSVSMAGYNISDNQIWEVVPSDTCQKVIFRCKELDKSSSSPKSLYLSYNNEGLLTVSKEKNTSFYLGNPNYSWLRFGEIYFQGIKDKKSDYYRAISNYSNNESIGLRETTNTTTGVKSNIYYDSGIKLDLILNQNNGYFPSLKFGEMTMNRVVCEVIGTYNAMCIAKGNPENLNFFKLASEFEINAPQINPLLLVPKNTIGYYIIDGMAGGDIEKYGHIGGLGSDPLKIGDCLDAYDMDYDKVYSGRALVSNKDTIAAQEHSPQCAKMEDMFKNNGAKSGIISYTFDNLTLDDITVLRSIRIHTFALRYNPQTGFPVVYYNKDCSEEVSESKKDIESIFGSEEYFYVGYVLY